MKTLNNSKTTTAAATANSMSLLLKGLVILSVILISVYIGLSKQLFASEMNVKTESSNASYLFVAEQNDSELNVEDWMTDESFFSVNQKLNIEEEKDTQLEIADWMHNTDYFSSNS